MKQITKRKLGTSLGYFSKETESAKFEGKHIYLLYRQWDTELWWLEPGSDCHSASIQSGNAAPRAKLPVECGSMWASHLSSGNEGVRGRGGAKRLILGPFTFTSDLLWSKTKKEKNKDEEDIDI